MKSFTIQMYFEIRNEKDANSSDMLTTRPHVSNTDKGNIDVHSVHSHKKHIVLYHDS